MEKMTQTDDAIKSWALPKTAMSGAESLNSQYFQDLKL
jgi:hypothetical protein